MFLIFIPAALIFRSESTAQLALVLRRLFTAGIDAEAAFRTLGLDGPSLLALALTLAAMNALHVWGDYDLPPAGTETAAARRKRTAPCSC